MRKDHIKLEEAMTMELKECVRVWDVDGLQVTAEDIPKNANVRKTFIIAPRGEKITVGVIWAVEGELSENYDDVDQVSDVQELKDKFPKLFELTGELYTIA